MHEARDPITVRLPAELQDRVDAIAQALDRSHSWVVERAVETFVELAEIKQAVAEADAGDFASDDEVEAVFKRWQAGVADEG